ncbi:hypothetical protein Nepgr_005167 [Nepenthes gracilis]|uniref:Uncharacterized protein n=1 Tax=Nepenthes gracilis TaxID=150966 RepID=A0AAD3XG37_NEPGR|nr:hypothetical protein Nepgr_005167 [Nepenthes gracilis]
MEEHLRSVIRVDASKFGFEPAGSSSPIQFADPLDLLLVLRRPSRPYSSSLFASVLFLSLSALSPQPSLNLSA